MPVKHLVRTLCLALLLGVCGCGGSRLTAENFDQITDGMTRQEVLALLGPPEMTNFSTMPGGREEQWYYSEGKKTASVAFLGDSVVHYASTGLHD